MSAPTPAPAPETTDFPARAGSVIPPVLPPITVRPSRLLWHLQWLVHLLLASSLLGALWPHALRQPLWWIILLVAFAILVTSVLVCYRAVKLASVILGFDQDWYLETTDGRRHVQLVGEVVVWQWLILMRFRPSCGGRRINLALLPDSADPESLRRLRVWLRTSLHHRDRAQ